MEEKGMQKVLGTLRDVVRTCRLVWGFAPWFTVATMVAAIISTLLPLAQAKITGAIVDTIVDSLSQGFVVPLMLIALYAGTLAVSRLSDAVRVYFNKRMFLEAQQGVDLAMMRRRADIDIAHYEDPNFQNLLTQAFDKGNHPLLNVAEHQFGNISLVVGILVSAGFIVQYPLIFLIILVSLIPTLIVQMRYGKMRWAIWAENSPRQKMYADLRSHLHGRQSVIQTKMLQASEHLIDRARTITDDFKKDQIGVDRARLWYTVIAALVSSVGIGYALYRIIGLVTSGLVGVGSVVFLISLVGQFVGMLSGLFRGIGIQYEDILYVKDIFRVFDTPAKIVEVAEPTHLHLSAPPTIEFRDVSFKYAGTEAWVLRNVSFTIKPGEKIALIGENGAGKTTLLKLLARTYDPTEGQILINGVPLNELSLKEWNSYLAILLQDYRIHNFTVADAIAVGRVEQVPERVHVERASSLAGADSFVREFDDAYDAQIGVEFDRGVELSQGQKQRLALARTLYRNGFVIVLDEPTASVDSIAEERFFSQIEDAVRGKTLILVSHRFNTTASADRILVFRGGALIEMGTHHDLIRKNGHYADMWQSQAKSFIESASAVQ